MELNWSTFVLEIINFLVLVWILKRFFYKPVLNVITRRRAELETTTRESEEARKEAEALKARYEDRLGAWEQEKARAREALQAELQAEQARAMSALQEKLAEAREKEEVLSQGRVEKLAEKSEELAIAHATRFASQLLGRVAGPELDSKLVNMMIEDLRTLPDERREAMRPPAEWQGPVTVTSAHPLNAKLRKSLENAVAELPAGKGRTFVFQEDASLISGLSVSVGSWVLQANLRDELHFFAEGSDGES